MAQPITRDELKARLEAGNPPVLVEALPEQYFRKEHLPGAVNIPHDEIDALAPEVLLDKDAEIVTYCASATCRNSELAAKRLEALGYTNVREYVEGKADWIEAGLPTESGQVKAAA